MRRIDIGVIGQSGVGKSSFINKLCRMLAGDNRAAYVGTTQGTYAPKMYLYNNYPSIALWDLPGLGTPEFMKEDYLKAICFQRYTSFFLLSAERFREDDVWLIRQMQRSEKGYFYVRTKIDQDLLNESVDYPLEFRPDLVVRMIRDDLAMNLRNHCDDQNLPYLVSNRSPRRFDFPALRRMLDSLCLGWIATKRELLMRRIRENAIFSTCGVLVPLFYLLSSKCTILVYLVCLLLTTLVDVAVLLSEITLYYQETGICSEDLDRISILTGTDRNVLATAVGNGETPITAFSSYIKIKIVFLLLLYWIFTRFAFSMIFLATCFVLIPAGFLLGTVYFLSHCLDEVRDAALSVVASALEKLI